MAVAKARFPLDEITGVLGKVDRSVGREQGLALCISSSPNSSILSKKTKKTTTRSPAQQERAAIYCDCDHGWRDLPFWKGFYTCTYRKKVQGLSTYRFSWYLCWMSLCMADAWNENLFVLNSYVSRYVIKNTSGAPWIGHKITLIDIPTKQANGWDVAIQETDYKRLPQRTLEHKVNAKGSVIVCLPDMTPGRTIYIDVYSYGNYSTPQNCPVTTEAELNASVLANSNTVPYDFTGAYNVDVSFTPSHDGPLYMMYMAYYCGSGTNVNLSTNTPKNEYIGDTGKTFYGIPLYIWSFGFLEAGQPYNITGRISDPGSEACTCGDPAGYISYNWNYYGAYPYNKKDYSPGAENACHPDWYAKFKMIQLQAEAYEEISPESTVKIGPT
jgi:hypothetical protein